MPRKEHPNGEWLVTRRREGRSELQVKLQDFLPEPFRTPKRLWAWPCTPSRLWAWPYMGHDFLGSPDEHETSINHCLQENALCWRGNSQVHTPATETESSCLAADCSAAMCFLRLCIPATYLVEATDDGWRQACHSLQCPGHRLLCCSSDFLPARHA